MIVCCLRILLPIRLPDGGVQQQWHALRRISQGVNSLEARERFSARRQYSRWHDGSQCVQEAHYVYHWNGRCAHMPLSMQACARPSTGFHSVHGQLPTTPIKLLIRHPQQNATQTRQANTPDQTSMTDLTRNRTDLAASTTRTLPIPQFGNNPASICCKWLSH